MTADGVGGRSLWLLGAVAVAVFTASCTTAPGTASGARVTASSARAAASSARLTAAGFVQAKADCAAVGRELGAPPGDHKVWIQDIIAAPRSGIAAIDTPMRELAAALRGTSIASTDEAFSRAKDACVKLGLWEVYH